MKLAVALDCSRRVDAYQTVVLVLHVASQIDSVLKDTIILVAWSEWILQGCKDFSERTGVAPVTKRYATWCKGFEWKGCGSAN